MDLRWVALVVGLAVLVAMPTLPSSTLYIVQAVAATILVVYGSLQLLARVPVSWITNLLRAGCIALGLACAVSATHFPIVVAGMLMFFAVPLILIGFWPLLPERIRRHAPKNKAPFHRLVFGLFATYFVVETVTQLVSWHVPHFARYGVWGFFIAPGFRKGAQPTLEDDLTRIKTTSAELLDCLTVASLVSMVERLWQHSLYFRRLHSLRTKSLTETERYARLLKMCADSPRVELGWRIAYAAALTRADWERAAELDQAARAVGFDLSSGDRELLRTAASLGPTWRDLLSEEDRRRLAATAPPDSPPRLRQNLPP